MNIEIFSGFSQRLDNLSYEIKNLITEIIFTKRNDVISVTVVFPKREPVEELVSFQIPIELLRYNSKRFGVDLESIGSNKVRLYVDDPFDRLVSIYGYYLDSFGTIYEKKVYKRNGKTSILIDRYDSNDVLISENEEEVSCTSKDWKGPLSLAKAANINGYETVFIRKKDKDQCYLRVIKR